ncbi:uncharacterized protein LOC122371075 [Amphibalanus amphitrite]|uniref:uncharacterized protein LOC122371075 n=1 Tax=Amphibalanus amphitrite TaxID=1232801 RepID=UPI001C91821D|nr:uncharacterized protein LOC122371075 [Amphibalanus amphitrite]
MFVSRSVILCAVMVICVRGTAVNPALSSMPIAVPRNPLDELKTFPRLSSFFSRLDRMAKANCSQLAGEGRDLSVSAGPAPLTPSEGDPTGVMAAPLPHRPRSGWHSANDVCTDRLLTLKTEGELAKTAVLQRLSELQRAIGRVGDELGDLRPAVEQLAQSIITAVENGKEDILTELGYLRSDYTQLARTLELLQSRTDDSLRDISSRLDMLANAPQPRPSCPAGSTQRPDGRCYTCPALSVLHTDDNCYFGSDSRTTYDRAKQRCMTAGFSHLATVTAENRGLDSSHCCWRKASTMDGSV